MQYAANLTTLPSRRSILAPLVALVVGAAAAVGGYALIDDQSTTVQAPDKVVFVDTPAPGVGVRGIDDMSTAATSSAPTAVVPYLSHGSGVPTGNGASAKHEASTAAAIGSGSSGGDAAGANRTDIPGPVPGLHP
jgi:hypothetical protein